MALIDLNKKYDDIKESVSTVKFTDVELPTSFKSEYENYLSNNKANGYQEVEWAKCSTKITTSSGKAIYLTNFWFYIASELSNYLDGLTQQKEIFNAIYQGEDLYQAANTLRREVNEEEKCKIEQYFLEHNYSEKDLEFFLAFVSDYKSWGGGKSIDRNDVTTQRRIKELATEAR